jgi:hypothetical protein
MPKKQFRGFKQPNEKILFENKKKKKRKKDRQPSPPIERREKKACPVSLRA